MDWLGFASEITNIGATFGINAYNNEMAAQRTAEDRMLNYKYNEKAAYNADKRTRALYNDFYSPEALLKQYIKAGLSPSLMFGGTPGQGGLTGSQGGGPGGPQTTYMPISLLEAAQANALFAEAEKTKAETENVKKDTDIKGIQEQLTNLDLEMKNRQNTEEQLAWNITNSTWIDKKTGKETSLFEMANDYYSYESFLQAVRNEETHESIKQAASTETGQKVLRRIYESANQFHRDIMVLSSEEVNASFQIDLINALKNNDFAKLNGEAAAAQLSASIESYKLDERQKEAWNNMLNRLGRKGSLGSDIAIVLGMIVQAFAGKVGVQIKTGI